MKKKICLILILLFLPCLFLFAGCDNNEINANFRNFEYVENETYSIKVDNDVEILNFSNIVEIDSLCTWTLNTDIYAMNSIPSKVATLNVGDNTYYVLVTAQNSEVKLYTLKIRRLPIYTVTYRSSTGTVLQTIRVQEGECVEPIEPAQLNGYTYEAWLYDFTQPIMSNTSIIAKYNANEYNVTLKHNGGTYSIDTIKAVYNAVLPMQSTVPHKLGYTFSGYYSDDNEMYYNSSMTGVRRFAKTNNIELTARYTLNNYSVRYELNNGTDNVNNVKVYNVEMDNIQLVDSEKTGYDFVNWTLDGEPVTEINTHLCKNLILTANFTPTVYTITYVLNGGTNSENNPITYTIETPTITLEPAIFENENICRWYLEETFNNRVTQISKGSCGNKVFYAKIGYDYNDVLNISSSDVIGLNLDFLSEFHITEIIIPEGITRINSDVFMNKTFITLIKIPSTVTVMSSGILSGCSALNSVSIPFIGASTTATGESSLFGYIFGTHNYSGSTAITQTFWSDINGSYSSVTYYVPTVLENVEIGHSTNIKSEAFSGCSSLTSWTFLTINSGVIPDFTFRYCTNLTHVIMKDDVTRVGRQAFEYCTNLVSLALSHRITFIDVGAFMYCNKLISVLIPNSVIGIDYGIFVNCSLLTIYCEAESKPTNWVANWNANDIPTYWYSEIQPTTTGNYWHYVNGEIVEWGN